MKRNLYHVQDNSRPMYVVAKDWQDAIDKWKKVIAHENELSIDDTGEPDGVHLVAGDDDLICDVITLAEDKQ